MIEIWKDIKDFEGLYQVSNLGRVRSLKYGKERILKVSKNNKGYLCVCLCKDGYMKTFKVHRLVAETFIPNPLNLPQVNHKIEGEEGKQINTVENLEWCDNRYNSNYGTRNKRIFEKTTNGKLSKPVLQFSKTGEFIQEWVSMSEIERQLGYYNSNISHCCSGIRKTAYGFIWKYKGEE